MRMRFGLFIMPIHLPRENPTLTYERNLRLIEYVESLGFDEVWIGEHHSSGWESIPSPDIFIAAAAQRTKRIRLGTGVLCLPFHHPFHVAERMAFLDHLTYGRAMLGIGPGALPTDIKLFALDHAQLRPMMDESLDIILKLFNATGPIDYQGRYWTLKEAELQVKCYQDPHLPIAVASVGAGHSLDLAATHGLSLVSSNFQTGAKGPEMAKIWRAFKKKAAAKKVTPRRQDWRIANTVYVADSVQQAYADIEKGATEHMRDYSMVIKGDIAQRKATDFPKALRDRGMVIGSPDDCIRQIQELRDGSGGFGTFLITTNEWTTYDKVYRNLELFARYVMPEFQGSNSGQKRSWEGMMDKAVPDWRTGQR